MRNLTCNEITCISGGLQDSFTAWILEQMVKNALDFLETIK